MIRHALFAGLGVACGFLAAFLIFQLPEHRLPHLTTEYQLVLLTSGQTYFGKLEKLGTPYPVL